MGSHLASHFNTQSHVNSVTCKLSQISNAVILSLDLKLLNVVTEGSTYLCKFVKVI